MKPVPVAGKIVAVTGGARGIGLAIATTLHGLGARVAIGDIDEAAVKEAGSRLGLRVSRGLDVTDRESFTDFLDAVPNARPIASAMRCGMSRCAEMTTPIEWGTNTRDFGLVITETTARARHKPCTCRFGDQ
jgi:NAD(P)-dependent dehydrogenase (short-subunit alcohol dehydrogenase family)